MTELEFLDGFALHRLLEGGCRNLKKNMQTVNELNVFPVPDGDTGTNMVMTVSGGYASAEATANAGAYMDALARGCLLSARGNSGVIFSQFFHGLARGMAGKEAVSFPDLAQAFACAKEAAYNAILTPTEGTILTVIREASEFLQTHAGAYATFADGMTDLVSRMHETLRRTPELLPVLKEAGVVDSGGAGLVCFMEGALTYLQGKDIADTPLLTDAPAPAVGAFGPDSELTYGYCTEFILQLQHKKTDIAAFTLDGFLPPLQELGDSIVAVVSDSLVKLHIHTFTPERVLAYGRQFGEFVTLKIENMSVQHSEAPAAAPAPRKQYAVVAVASGEGVQDYFREIGADGIISGGQTNNPPVEAFLDAFRGLNADHIIVLPNNSNVILTARQAAELYHGADVRVIPSKSIAEGCSALSLYNPDCSDIDTLLEEMSSGAAGVTTGYVTTAIRDAEMGGVKVKKGSYIGLDRETILCSAADRVEAAFTLVETIHRRAPKDIIIVFRGKAVPDADAAALEDRLRRACPCAEIGFLEGGQEIYDFIISLE